MSISISPNSLLASDLYASASDPVTQGAATASIAAITAPFRAISGTSAATASSPTDPLLQDLTMLLQALAAGNVSGAQSDVTKMKADLKSQESAGTPAVASTAKLGQQLAAASSSDSTPTASTSDTYSSQSTSALGDLLAQVSSSLGAGSTAGALHNLAGFMVQIGQGTGNLIDATA